MLFWILSAALAAMLAATMGRALFAGGGTSTPTAAYDMCIYRDQLAEVARDRERGVIGAEEAARLETEISRRLLDADRAAARAAEGGKAPRWATMAAALAIAATLAGGLALYWRIGVPGYDDMPLAGRLALAEQAYQARPDQQTAEARAAERLPAPALEPTMVPLVEQLRAAVAARPNDLQGLQLLVQTELGAGDYRAAWAAQRRIVALLGEAATGEDYAILGDLMVLAAGGLVTPAAEAVLIEALERDPANGVARYYIGLMLAQNGRPDRTFRFWAPLLAEGPEDAPWTATIRESIAELAWLAGEQDYTAPAPAVRGPSDAEIDAAAGLPVEEREAMIRGMVEGLNARLATQGGTAEDWARLIGALGVLGERERAAAIWTEAGTVFAAHPESLALIGDAAAGAGLAAPRRDTGTLSGTAPE